MTYKENILEVIMVGSMTLILALVVANIAVGIVGDSFQGHEQFYFLPVYELAITIWLTILYIIYIRVACKWVVDNSKGRSTSERQNA